MDYFISSSPNLYNNNIVVIIVFLVISIIIANTVAWFLQFRQQSRIHEKIDQIVHFTETQQDQKKIPITIVTGFLGSGKTTLLNYILSHEQQKHKIMVIENEVGAISIDHNLIKPGKEGRPAEGIIVLENGCMCCNFHPNGNELERILDQFLQMINSDTSGYDYIIIETTGLSDPGPIIKTLLELRSSRFVLDGVVAVVDSKSLLHHLTGRYKLPHPLEADSQLIYADVVILNKSDLVSTLELEMVKEEISRRNTDSRVFVSKFSKVDIETILHVQTFNLNRFYEKESFVGNADVALHTSDIHAVHFLLNNDLHLKGFQKWMSNLVDENAKSNIFRVKGILAFDGSNKKYIIQGVLDTFTLTPSTPWHKNEEKQSRLVIIGRNIERDRLWEGLKECVLDDFEEENMKKNV